MTEACTKHSFAPAALGDPATGVWLANGLGAKAAILGQLSNLDDKLTIEVTAYKTQDGKRDSRFPGKRGNHPGDMRALLRRCW
jgi:hypothetical protein